MQSRGESHRSNFGSATWLSFRDGLNHEHNEVENEQNGERNHVGSPRFHAGITLSRHEIGPNVV